MILISPLDVETISCPFTSKFPPSCGVVSTDISPAAAEAVGSNLLFVVDQIVQFSPFHRVVLQSHAIGDVAHVVRGVLRLGQHRLPALVRQGKHVFYRQNLWIASINLNRELLDRVARVN